MKKNVNQGGNDRPRSNFSKPEQKSKGVIRFERSVFELPEGRKYVGEITDCRVADTKKGESLFLAINFEKSRTTFKKFLPYPLSDDSPVGKAFMTIDVDEDSEFYCEMVVGLPVEFSTQFNGGFCNFKTFEILWDDEDDDGESDDSNDSDEEDEFEGFYDED